MISPAGESDGTASRTQGAARPRIRGTRGLDSQFPRVSTCGTRLPGERKQRSDTENSAGREPQWDCALVDEWPNKPGSVPGLL